MDFEEKMTAIAIMCIVLGFFGLIGAAVFTDEYEVVQSNKCERYLDRYTCRVVNGENLAFCKTAEECTKKCEEYRADAR